MKFRSKVDAWLVVAIVVAGAVTLQGVHAVCSRPFGPLWIVGLVSIAVGVVLPLWLLLSTTYEVTKERLLIRSGPFRWVVARTMISRITPTRSVISSPALSLDRLRIDHGPGRTVLVSPRDKDAFLAALRSP